MYIWEFLMPKTKYHLVFTEDDIEKLQSVYAESNPSTRLHLRAKVLLTLERSTHTHMTTLAIAQECGTTDTTVQTIRTNYALYGLDDALYTAKRETPPIKPKYKDIEKQIISLAKDTPPAGEKKWTVRLLADYCKKLGYSDTISYPTVFRILKKNGINLK